MGNCLLDEWNRNRGGDRVSQDEKIARRQEIVKQPWKVGCPWVCEGSRGGEGCRQKPLQGWRCHGGDLCCLIKELRTPKEFYLRKDQSNISDLELPSWLSMENRPLGGMRLE